MPTWAIKMLTSQRMTAEFKAGDLVQVVRCGSFTLCYALRSSPPGLRERPVNDLKIYSHSPVKKDNIFEDLEGNLGLIVYVILNRLDQTMGYRVLIKGKEMFCKSKVAEKYFKLAETQDDESGGPSKI
jgi:hypothetical protein